MKRNASSEIMSNKLFRRGGVALLWDESFLWGIMALKALQKAGLSFELIRADEIRRGDLEKYATLFVPGGWSSNKIKALGKAGVEAVKRFVYEGGNYLGFCGGAGLATLDGIGLLNIKRKPTKERIPSFSGRIRLRASENPAWKFIDDPVFHAWWPPQFSIEENGIKVLASYEKPLPESFSSDLNVGDIESSGTWADLEQLYRINLDPKRLIDEPAVVEGIYGSGKVLLSLVHFDTPNDKNGLQVLKNLWDYLSGHNEQPTSSFPLTYITAASVQGVAELESAVTGIIDLGIRNFLWFWRNPMLLQWRRGVRGLEYCTLIIMVREIAERIGSLPNDKNSGLENNLKEVGGQLAYFSEKAQRLLILERLAMQNGHITYERCDDPEMQKIREELFSSSKSYGGLFKEIIDSIDDILYMLIKQEQTDRQKKK